MFNCGWLERQCQDFEKAYYGNPSLDPYQRYVEYVDCKNVFYFGWLEWQVFGCVGHPELLKGKLKIFPPAIFAISLNLCWLGRKGKSDSPMYIVRSDFYLAGQVKLDNKYCR